jgi:acyl-CoA thioesterase-1
MRSICLIACMLLSACGDRPKPEAPVTQPTPEPAPAARDDRPVIAAFGDSLTAGFGLDPGLSYPDLLQKELDRRGLSYHVVNLGTSGETSGDGLARLAQVIELRPKIVILEFGANDGLRGVPVASMRSNLERMIVELQKAGAQIVLAGMTLPPNYGPDYVRSFQAVYIELAAKYQLALVPFLLEGVAGDERYMQRDGLHPNVKGTRRVMNNVMRVLAPLLKKP